MTQIPTFLCDGVATIASHNGVHRITLYRLGNDPNPQPAVELQLPDRAIIEFVTSLQRLAGLTAH